MLNRTVSLLCLASTTMLLAACSLGQTDSEGSNVAAIDSEAQPEDDLACDGLEGLGSYEGYFCAVGSVPSFQADAISCSDALAECEQNSASNPLVSVTCQWNGVTIFVYETSSEVCGGAPTQPVCGLFRGANMIASPNPASSVEDTDEACIAFCDASNPEADDLCFRDGIPLKAYDGPRQPVCGLFRGGLSEADNMIASPNPASSVEDTDEACIAYCNESNPELGDLCARDGNVIKTYDDSAMQPVCGLFRGANMIASPNPANSVEDTDEACIAYCDASNPEADDICLRDGIFLKVYDGPRPPLCGLFRGGLSTADNMIASPNPARSIEDTDEACIAYCTASHAEPGDLCVRDDNVIFAY